MGPQAIPDIHVLFCIKDVFKITEIIEPTGCFNQNHVSLVFDDYKLSLQWEKKIYFPLGRLYHPVAKQIHHRTASMPMELGSGKFFPGLATVSFTPYHLNITNLQRSHCCVVAKGFAALSLPKTTNQPERMACVHRTKNRVSTKGAPSVAPRCLRPPCHRS